MSEHEAARRQGDTGADAAGSPPARDERPRPQYGEYAPEGWTWQPPAGDHISDPAPQMAQPSAGRAGRPHAAPPAPPALPQPAASDALARRRRIDRMLTIAFLVIGAFGAWSTAAGLQDLPRQIQVLYDQQGIGQFVPGPNLPTIVLIGTIAQLAIYAATLGFSVLRLRRGRIAFWVPLVGLALSFVATMVLTSVIFLTDPTFLAYLEAQTSG
jgi:hypothetical protein